MNQIVSLVLIGAFVFQQAAFAAPDLFSGTALGESKHAESMAWAKKTLPAIPESVAVVEDAYRAERSKGTIILIQDAHTNNSAQLNVAKTLDRIFAAGGTKYVFLEAGAGDESLSFLRPFASLETRKQVAKSFLMKGKLQGTEYLDLTSDHELVLWGVEDMQLYAQSIESYRAVAKERDKFSRYLSRIESTIQTLKTRLFNPSLTAFDAKRMRFVAGEMSMTDYFETLLEEAQRAGIGMSDYPNMRHLSEVRKLESAVDFEKLNEEQRRAIASLSEQDQADLRELSSNQTLGQKISSKDPSSQKGFTALLEEKLGKNLKDYPALSHYFRYMDKASELDSKNILREQKSLEGALYAALSIRQDETHLVLVSRQIEVMKKLLDLTLTPEEFDAFMASKSTLGIREISAFLNKKIMDLKNFYENAVFLEDGFEDIARRSEEFYLLTRQRDEAFVSGMKAKMISENQAQAVLITGGYHAPNVKRLLKDEGFSYISVTPQVFHETDMARYERILLSYDFDVLSLGLRAQPLAGPAHTNMPLRIFGSGALGDPAGQELAQSLSGARISNELSRAVQRRERHFLASFFERPQKKLLLASWLIHHQLNEFARQVLTSSWESEIHTLFSAEEIWEMQKRIQDINVLDAPTADLINGLFSRGIDEITQDDLNNAVLMAEEVGHAYYDKVLTSLQQMKIVAAARLAEDDSMLGANASFADVVAAGALLSEFASAQNEAAGSRLSEKTQQDKLNDAIQEVQEWKDANAGSWNKPNTNPFITLLQDKAMRIYRTYEIYSLPIEQRMQFVLAVYDSKNFRTVYSKIFSAYREFASNLDSKLGRLTAAQYSQLAQKLSIYEQKYSISDYTNLRIAISLLFDFFSDEASVLEQAYVIDEINAELARPGSGNLQQVAAIQDLHGGARRLQSLVGFALGLPADNYANIHSLRDLKAELLSHNIDVRSKNIRIVGLADQYDRGSDPVGVADTVRWLGDNNKSKFFVGNHDFWRLMGVLQVQKIFDARGVDYHSTENTTHHIAFWAEDAFRHTGWGDIELDQVNQKQFNESVVRLNKLIRIFNRRMRKQITNPIREFDLLDLDLIRSRYNADLKSKKKRNAELRQLKRDNPNDAEIQERVFADLPDIFYSTLAHTRLQIQEFNLKITRFNEVYSEYGLALPQIEIQLVDLENYHRNPEIIQRALWELQNFRLFYVDVYGNPHMHNILPVKDEGGFDVDYKGFHGLEALELMSQKVQDFFQQDFFQDYKTLPDDEHFRDVMWGELGEVFEIINSWYSDRAGYVKAKAENVKAFVDEGGMERYGVGILGHSTQLFAPRQIRGFLILGHNERAKFDLVDLPSIVPYPSIGSAILNIDYELSPGYSDRGAIMTIFKRDQNGRVTGLRIWGFEKGSDVIKDMTFQDVEGLDPEQRAMLELLHDGVGFMKWYKTRTLRYMIDELKTLIRHAQRDNRQDKVRVYEAWLNTTQGMLESSADQDSKGEGSRLANDDVFDFVMRVTSAAGRKTGGVLLLGELGSPTLNLTALQRGVISGRVLPKRVAPAIASWKRLSTATQAV